MQSRRKTQLSLQHISAIQHTIIWLAALIVISGVISIDLLVQVQKNRKLEQLKH